MGDGAREAVALSEGAAEAGERAGLLRGLDALGDQLQGAGVKVG